MSGPSIAVNIPLSGRTIALGCLAASALGLAASVALSWPPAAKVGLSGLLSFAPQAAGFVALLGGGLCLLLDRTPLAKQSAPEAASSLVPAMQAIFRDFNRLLMEEHDRLAAFQEVFGTTTKEAMDVSGRLSKLATAAADAEVRLGAGVARAEEALRQPTLVVTWAAEAAQRVEQALPELADVIRREIAEQSRPANAALEAAAVRLTSDTDGPLRTFTDAVTLAAAQIATLGETTSRVRQDIVGLDTAGREIATASAVVVARVGEAVGHFETTLAKLPEAAIALTEATQQAAQNVVEATTALTAGSGVLDLSGREALQVVKAVQTAAQGIADRLDGVDRDLRQAGDALVRQAGETKVHVDAALAGLPGAAAEVTTAARTLNEAASVLRTEGIRLTESGRETVQAAETLGAAGRDIAAAAAVAVRHAERAVGQVDDAVAHLPRITAEITAVTDQAAQTLTEAAAALCAEGAALEASGRESSEAAAALRANGLEAIGNLHAAADGLRDAASGLAGQNSEAMARVNDTFAQFPGAAAVMTAAVDHAAQTLGDAGAGLRADRAALDATLNATLNAAQEATLAAAALQAAGQDIGAASAVAVSQVGHAAAQVEQALDRLPEIATGVTTTANGAVRTLAATAETLAATAEMLAANGAALDASTRQTRQATEALLVAEQSIINEGQHAAAFVSQATETTTERLMATLTEIDQGRQTASGLTERVQAAAAALMDRTGNLDMAGQRMVAAAEGVIDRLMAGSAASEAVMRVLPGAAAELNAAAEGLRLEAATVTAAAQQMSATGLSAASAITDIIHRTEGAGATLDTAGHAIGDVSESMAIQISRLATVTARAETQAALLPEAARSIRAAADRVAAAADRIPTADTAATGAAEAVIVLAGLAADISEAFGRFEAALANQEDAWPSVIHAMADTQAALAEVRATIDQPADASPASSHFLDGSCAPAALAATL